MFTQMNCIKKILQFLRGVVGTWKTQIIKVIQCFFWKTKDEPKLHIATYIANATLLIGGITIHSLLNL
jgi:hypothetical protein